MSKKKGFTLIELLVVIAIIALLLSIIAPALGKAKHITRRMLCASNMHQWAVGLSAYALDNKNYFPYNGWDPLPGYLPYDAANVSDPQVWTPGYDVAWNSRKVQEFWRDYVMKVGSEMGTKKNNVLFCPTQVAHRTVAAANLDMAINQGLCGYFYLPYRQPPGPDYNWDSMSMKYTPAGIGWVSKETFGGKFAHAPLMTDITQAWMGATSPEVTKWVGAAGPYSNHVTRGGQQPDGQNYMFEDGRVTWIKWTYIEDTDKSARKLRLGAYTLGAWDCYYKVPFDQ
ncbi:MAG: type II secretion system GspH family protein [Planctomycetaceae bacterium]|nr:type II secretion system GspH family protein [Planctomycetaceae bacterium]